MNLRLCAVPIFYKGGSLPRTAVRAGPALSVRERMDVWLRRFVWNQVSSLSLHLTILRS